MLAEANRQPFDLLCRLESELVSGYNVEYSAMTFALFFLAEYSNMLLMSSLAAICLQVADFHFEYFSFVLYTGKLFGFH
jgi:NADH:ubiquinone oxidoreductase subunit H